MLPSSNIQSIIGATLFSTDGEKIARVTQVFVDAGDGHPTWAQVTVGTIARHSTFVPLDDATWEHDDVTVPFTKNQVKNAPRPDADGGLDPDQEDELRRHYAASDESDERTDEAERADDSERTDHAERTDDSERTGDAERTDDAERTGDAERADHSERADDSHGQPRGHDEVLWQDRVVVRKERVPVAKVHVEDLTVSTDSTDEADRRSAPAETSPDDDRPPRHRA
jgi:hypothetical protein